MKRFCKKILICILIVTALFNFILSPYQTVRAEETSSGGSVSKAISSLFNGGLVGVLTWVPRALMFGVTARNT